MKVLISCVTRLSLRDESSPLYLRKTRRQPALQNPKRYNLLPEEVHRDPEVGTSTLLETKKGRDFEEIRSREGTTISRSKIPIPMKDKNSQIFSETSMTAPSMTNSKRK
ncbi:hypothetical protein K440DRAFT_224224 [Wilcoxina mikolae CBS 423.85]|nr:hypothetical protein K440DRAFT_224224 [Wilcoxina mikolae CBS 423.85]